MRTLVVLLCCGFPIPAQEWPARIVNLVPHKAVTDEGSKTKVRIDANTIVCVTRKSAVCNIPLRSITALSHDTRIRNRAAAFLESGGSCYGMDCFGQLAIAGALAPFRANWRYIVIAWIDNGTPRVTVLRFGASDFPAFEREVATRTNLIFQDAASERAELEQRIEQHKSEALPVRLDRGTFVRNEYVRGGMYQVLVLERQPGSGDLYFFRGKAIKAKTPALVVPVLIAVTSAGGSSAEGVYSARQRWKNLEAIRMPGKIVTVVP